MFSTLCCEMLLGRYGNIYSIITAFLFMLWQDRFVVKSSFLSALNMKKKDIKENINNKKYAGSIIIVLLLFKITVTFISFRHFTVFLYNLIMYLNKESATLRQAPVMDRWIDCCMFCKYRDTVVQHYTFCLYTVSRPVHWLHWITVSLPLLNLFIWLPLVVLRRNDRSSSTMSHWRLEHTLYLWQLNKIRNFNNLNIMRK